MLNTVSFQSFKQYGEVGKLADKIITNWLVGLRETNPAILDIFRDREIKPYRDLLPWSGEFAGKYITSAYYIYKLTSNQELYDYIITFIKELLNYQSEEGYLGCFCKEVRLTGATSLEPDNIGTSWDCWSHYHIMYGLYLWYDITKDKTIWDSLKQIADFFIYNFYNGKKRMIDTGFSEMNLSPIHIFCLLYNDTKDLKYLEFAREIEKDLADNRAGNYINNAKNNLEFYQFSKPRWESLHIIMGISKMYECTGDKTYLEVVKQIFYSILKTDIHNTGAFSTNEQAIGTPFKNGAIETCCVIAFNSLAIELLKLTGDLKVADFLELSLYNAVMGYYSPTGRWSTYHTPMDGEKCANFHSINFQCRAGSPELNCCSVNAPRGIGMVSQWAIMEEGETLYINCFESLSAVTDKGLTIDITGDYATNGTIKIHLHSTYNQRVAIRIPSWSNRTVVTFNDSNLKATAGEYLYFKQKWNDDTIIIRFDFGLRYLEGQMDFIGKSSIYRGPILYGYDLSLNPCFDFENIPAISKEELEETLPLRMIDGKILLRLKSGIVLCDFYHLGITGSQYKTWLVVSDTL